MFRLNENKIFYKWYYCEYLLSFMIVRLAIRYLYRSLPNGYYIAHITELLGLHLGSSTQSKIRQAFIFFEFLKKINS